MASLLTMLEQSNEPSAAYKRSARGRASNQLFVEARVEAGWPRHAMASQDSGEAGVTSATIQGQKQKTLYKLVDRQTGLLCQGGPWPCQWDAVGKTWPSMAALQRYLRSVLARGYHLKPRPVPEHWHIIEIEQIISHREKSVLPANVAIASQ